MGKKMFFTACVLSLLAARALRAQGGVSDSVFCVGVLAATLPENGLTQIAPAFCPAQGVANMQVQIFQDPNLTQLSDVLYVQQQFLYFQSDVNDILQPPDPALFPIVGRIQENGGIQDASSFFLLPTGGHLPPGYVQFQSDLNPIPEPTTIPVVAAGLAILVGARLRHRRIVKITRL
jgi:hypothetical protein